MQYFLRTFVLVSKLSFVTHNVTHVTTVISWKQCYFSSQIILVSLLVLVYNHSLVLVFRWILVLVLTSEGILVLVSVSGLFFCTRHQIFATVPAIKKSLHNTENCTCTIWKCFSVNYEDNISCNISSVLQTMSSSWQQVKNCLACRMLQICPDTTLIAHSWSRCQDRWSPCAHQRLQIRAY